MYRYIYLAINIHYTFITHLVYRLNTSFSFYNYNQDGQQSKQIYSCK